MRTKAVRFCFKYSERGFYKNMFLLLNVSKKSD
jgi:hypothetical protein